MIKAGSAHHFRVLSPTTAAVLGGVTAAVEAVTIAWSVVDHNFSNTGPVLIPTTMFAAVGVVVARRQPANPIGWLLILVALIENLFAVSASYVVFNHWLGHGIGGLPLVALWFENSFWNLGLIIGLPALLLFPDGKVPSRRWRVTLRVYVVTGVLVVASQCVTATVIARGHDLQVDTNGQPIGAPPSSGVLAFLGSGLAVLAIVPLLISWVVRQVVAFRRSDGVLRQQLKWSTLGAVVLVISLAVEVPLGNVASSTLAKVLNDVATAMFGAFPLGMGLGILKFRLYEVDRLISRTLSYALVTGVIVAAYVGVISLATGVLGFASPVGVATSTLVAAALFNPVRRRVQHLIDRRFNRARYDADALVSAFAARLRGATNLAAVQSDVVNTVYDALEPALIGFWIKDAT